LLVKVIIKEVFSSQSLRYIGYGVIQTNIKDFLKSMDLTLENVLNEKTDLYYYKEEF
jgi:hypothetical protein